MSEVNLIKITHFINPHMFWYKYEAECLNNVKWFELDFGLQQYFRYNNIVDRNFRPQQSEIFATYNFIWNRWVRAVIECVVDLTPSASKYIVWALDYGFPMQADCRYIRQLPPHLASTKLELVHFGGLSNIVPAKKAYSIETNTVELEPHNSWSPLAVKTVEQLINEAWTIKFIPSLEIRNREGHIFGSLQINTHKHSNIVVETVLKTINEATNKKDFFEIVREIRKIPRWQDNDGNCTFLITNPIKFNSIPTNQSECCVSLPASASNKKVEQKAGDLNKTSSKINNVTQPVNIISLPNSENIKNGVRDKISVAKPITPVQLNKEIAEIKPSSSNKNRENTSSSNKLGTRERRSSTASQFDIKAGNLSSTKAVSLENFSKKRYRSRRRERQNNSSEQYSRKGEKPSQNISQTKNHSAVSIKQNLNTIKNENIRVDEKSVANRIKEMEPKLTIDLEQQAKISSDLKSKEQLNLIQSKVSQNQELRITEQNINFKEPKIPTSALSRPPMTTVNRQSSFNSKAQLKCLPDKKKISEEVKNITNEKRPNITASHTDKIINVFNLFDPSPKIEKTAGDQASNIKNKNNINKDVVEVRKSDNELNKSCVGHNSEITNIITPAESNLPIKEHSLMLKPDTVININKDVVEVKKSDNELNKSCIGHNSEITNVRTPAECIVPIKEHNPMLKLGDEKINEKKLDINQTKKEYINSGIERNITTADDGKMSQTTDKQNLSVNSSADSNNKKTTIAVSSDIMLNRSGASVRSAIFQKLLNKNINETELNVNKSMSTQEHVSDDSQTRLNTNDRQENKNNTEVIEISEIIDNIGKGIIMDNDDTVSVESLDSLISHGSMYGFDKPMKMKIVPQHEVKPIEDDDTVSVECLDSLIVHGSMYGFDKPINMKIVPPHVVKPIEDKNLSEKPSKNKNYVDKSNDDIKSMTDMKETSTVLFTDVQPMSTAQYTHANDKNYTGNNEGQNQHISKTSDKTQLETTTIITTGSDIASSTFKTLLNEKESSYQEKMNPDTKQVSSSVENMQHDQNNGTNMMEYSEVLVDQHKKNLSITDDNTDECVNDSNADLYTNIKIDNVPDPVSREVFVHKSPENNIQVIDYAIQETSSNVTDLEITQSSSNAKLESRNIIIIEEPSHGSVSVIQSSSSLSSGRRAMLKKLLNAKKCAENASISNNTKISSTSEAKQESVYESEKKKSISDEHNTNGQTVSNIIKETAKDTPLNDSLEISNACKDHIITTVQLSSSKSQDCKEESPCQNINSTEIIDFNKNRSIEMNFPDPIQESSSQSENDNSSSVKCISIEHSKTDSDTTLNDSLEISNASKDILIAVDCSTLKNKDCKEQSLCENNNATETTDFDSFEISVAEPIHACVNENQKNQSSFAEDNTCANINKFPEIVKETEKDTSLCDSLEISGADIIITPDLSASISTDSKQCPFKDINSTKTSDVGKNSFESDVTPKKLQTDVAEIEEEYNERRLQENQGAVKKISKDEGNFATNFITKVGEIGIQANLTKNLVLVHGKHAARPIDRLANANFCEDIHRELANMRFTQIYRIQAFTWPHLMRGNSLMIINSARSGKTLAYLPAICSLIKMKVDDDVVPEGKGPIGIILATSAVEVEHIGKICRRFFNYNNNKFSVVQGYGVRNMNKITAQLLDGCDLLIATVPWLSRLLADRIKYLDNKRVQHLVIDNIDLMNDNLKPELQKILKKFCSINEDRITTTCQLVVTSRSWNSFLSGFLKIFKNPQLCIGAYIEAAVYARSKISMKLVKNQAKDYEILEFIRTHPYLSERLVIICNKNEEVEEVVAALKTISAIFTYCTSKSTANEIESTRVWHKQKPGDMSILVCTDSVLPELNIRKAQNMINYSLPLSWTKFSLRFSVFLDYYEDLTQKDYLTDLRAASLTLLDENNNAQLPKLVEFLQAHGKENIPHEIFNLSQRIRIQREESRISLRKELCPYLAEFGNCFERSDCNWRHTLTRFDTPEQDFPKGGLIKIKILNVLSPTHYCVRLLEQKSIETGLTWMKVRNSENYLKFNGEFSQYFADTTHHQIHFPINVGDLCVVIDFNMYYRCKVLDIKKLPGKASLDVNLRVKLVDNGLIIPCHSTNILVLPDEFKNYPFQAIDLHLVGLAPQDFEQAWDTTVTKTIKNWFDNYITDESHVQASLKLALKDKVWVENVIIVEKLKAIFSAVNVINIKQQLLEKKFAVLNAVGIGLLQQMSFECGIINDTTEKNNDAVNLTTISDEMVKHNVILSDDEHEIESNALPPSDTNIGANSSKLYSKNGTKSELKTDLLNQSNGFHENGYQETREKKVSIQEEKKRPNERWEKLPENEFCRVSVGSFHNPNLFYVQIVSNVDRLESLYCELNKYTSSCEIENIIAPTLGMNCLAKVDGQYNRGKITKIINLYPIATVAVFFVDIGLTETISLDHVINSTDYFINILPFQAIRCRLLGIQPLNNGIWTEKECDKIYDDVIDCCHYIYARNIKSVVVNHSISELKSWRHDVILLDCTTDKDVKLNVKIVDKGLANFDPDTKHFLNLLINVEEDVSSDDTDDLNWDHCDYQNQFSYEKQNNNDDSDTDSLQIYDFDVEFTEEEILQLLNAPPTARILPPPEEPRFVEIDNDNCSVFEKHTQETKEETNSNLENCESDSINSVLEDGTKVKNILMPQLLVRNKIPQVVWQQSESVICLSIYAPDIVDYYLKVTPTYLKFSASIYGEMNVLIINFLGGVDPEMTSHEIRGLNVVVRLVKALKGFALPRLCFESDTHLWLKYNFDAIILENERLTNTGLQFRENSSKLHYDASSDTDDSSDMEYGRVQDDFQNADKTYDPLSDIF